MFRRTNSGDLACLRNSLGQTVMPNVVLLLCIFVLMKMITALLFLLFVACCDVGSQERTPCYIESRPTFFDLRHGDWLANKWIRRAENLLTIHETFKKFGYHHLLGTLLTDNPVMIQGIYIKKEGFVLIDSLEETFAQPESAPKYYREFWARRRKEGNDSIVHLILKDIILSTQSKLGEFTLAMTADSTRWNDTLLHLLGIEFRYDSLTNELACEDFETLKRFGFHQSAYNLLYESPTYDKINWNRTELETTLVKSDTFNYPWVPDTNK